MVFPHIRDFHEAIGPEKLEFSATCASCGEMMPAQDEYLSEKKELFTHDNVCTVSVHLVTNTW